MTYGNPHKPFNDTVFLYLVTLLPYLYIEIINKVYISRAYNGNGNELAKKQSKPLISLGFRRLLF